MQRYDTYLSTSSDGSRYSYDTQDSMSTAPTSIHSPRPSVHQYATDRSIYSAKPSYDISPSTTYYPRSSTETYASTTASQDDFYEEPESYDPEYQVPEYMYNEEVESNLRPSTPSDFANFFPSSRRMYIRHDDTTNDGNMNLRVDTEDPFSRKKTNVQLFHMRMHDLKKMEFSLRRYERSSGREVCNSKRKFAKTSAERRPALTRSVSNAFSNMRGKQEFKRTNSGLSTHSSKSSKSSKSVKRQDSGYGSSNEDRDDGYFMSQKSSEAQEPTNLIKLEFSNYAQVEIKRRGAKASRRYEFEYWGYTYSWKRVTEKDGEGKAVSYHLFRNDGGAAVAHIVPEMQSPSQMNAEKVAGGWVPPCSMWISDKSVLEAHSDVPDVIVATGLIALLDDCIKRHFQSKIKHTHQVSLPLTQMKMDVDFVGPKAMVEHMFKRRNSGGSTKEREQRGSPLRFAQPVAAY